MKKLFFICAMMLTTIMASAQENTSVIKLKNGIEIKGTIVDEVIGESISVKTPEGDTFIYRMSEILRIDKPKIEERQKLAEREAQEKAKLEKKNNAKAQREKRMLGNFKGYRGIVEAYFGCGLTDPEYGLVGKFSFINGYQFNPYFYMGVGVGWKFNEFYTCLGSRSEHGDVWWFHPHFVIIKGYNIPIFLHLRTSWLKNRKVSPYFSLNVGYDLAISNNYYVDNADILHPTKRSSGILLEPALGIEIRTSRKTAVSVALASPMSFALKDIKGCYGYHENHFNLPVGGSIGFSF